MHELSVCLALLAQVERVAAEQGADNVLAIHIRVGPLSGVEPALLRHAWPLAAASSSAAGARLDILTGEIRVSCTQCRHESVVSPNRLLCAHCGDFRTRVLQGDDLLLERVELGNVAPASLPA